MFIGFVMVALVLGCLVLILWREPTTGPRPADLR